MFYNDKCEIQWIEIGITQTIPKYTGCFIPV